MGLAWQEFEADKAQQWIDAHLSTEPPLFLVEREGEDVVVEREEDPKSFRERMIQAYLRCASAALERQWPSGMVPPATLNQLARQTGLSRGFLCDVIHALLPDQARKSAGASAYRPTVAQGFAGERGKHGRYCGRLDA